MPKLGTDKFFDYRLSYILYLFIDRAFKTTLTEEKAMAMAAIVGFKSQPVKGYKTPAAKGMQMVL